MTAEIKPSPINPADLFAFKFIRAANLSPDGSRGVYCLSHTEMKEDEEREDHTSIWVFELETGKERQLTTGNTRDYNPEWSPDGKQIAFISTRGEKPQIYLIPVDGGEARQLTTIKQGVGAGPLWSPDGKYIAFTAGPEGEPPDPKKPYRVTRNIYRFDAIGYLDPAVQEIFVIPVEGGEPRQLTRGGWMNNPMSWSPDSKQILYTAAFRHDSFRIDPWLKTVDLEGETTERLGEWGGVAAARWMPDGERIIFMGTPEGYPIGSKIDLWVMSPGGEPSNRTSRLPMGVGGGLQGDLPQNPSRNPKILVNQEGTQAFVQVQAGGEIHIYRVALQGEEDWAPVVAGPRTNIPVDLRDGRLLYLISDFNHPFDLCVSDLSGSAERRLTQINEKLLRERSLPETEHLSWKSTDGCQVEGWLMRPTVGEAPYPTVLYIHGGPHSGFGHIFSFDFQMLAGAGYAVLFINQRGSKGYDDNFATQIIGDWGNLDYKDLMTGVDYAIEKGMVDPERMGVCGLSGGGNLSTWIIGQTDRFKAAVPENPVTNWVSFYGVSDIGPWFATSEMGGLPHEIPEVYARCSPITYAHNCKTPTLFIQGEADYRCPTEQSEQYYTVLKAHGCVAEMLRLPASPHAGSMDGGPDLRWAQNEALLDWMNKYVMGKEN